MSVPVTLLLVAGCAVVIVVIARAVAKGSPSQVDAVIDSSLADEVAERTGLPLDVVQRALAGDQVAADVTERIDACLVAVDVETARIDGSHDRVHVRRRAEFRGGEVRELTWEAAWDDLPDSVREQFIRSDETSVLGVWAPPWRSA